jgi:hypothetical protein
LPEEKGFLSTDKLEGVLKDLADNQYTGTLGVWDDSSWKEFYFAQTGVRMTSIGARKSLPIGEILVRRGFVDREMVNNALQAQASRRAMLGELLIEHGDLSEEHRDRALRWQLEEELTDLFFWPHPHYEYHAGLQTQTVSIVQRKRAETNTKSLSFQIAVHEVLRAAREEHKELFEIQRELSLRSIYRLSEIGRQKLFVQGGFKELSGPEQRIVVLIDGKKTLEEICQRALVIPNDALRIFHKLIKYGVIKPHDKETRSFKIPPLGPAGP